ncbi:MULTISPECIES: YcjF family protein [unclassified Vibrio]|uniref:YcjF family protein n=1 Tax=unclassified Vibrio TaxID=2614977 RepID=UPI001360EC2B|nr:MULTISPECIES: TIGR01620 family protein [unclassified Vibrio]NAW57552.1 TIGR01620 family protein [Vibrio sp. V36_P2S2PM302]NAX27934.1 TIGR01620 family protein [Vibrio sp. V38_P2S17PM301]NAX28875.1 TIGR01620 family protein [Vibrio sp. V37_P2S8PM304]
MSDLKSKQIFDQPLNDAPLEQDELTAQQQFNAEQRFVPQTAESESSDAMPEQQLEQVIRPRKGRKWLATGLSITFAALLGWQAVDSLVGAIQQSDWLALGWSGFIASLSALGIGAIGKELWKLRRLRNHFSVQEQSEQLILNDSVGHGKAFCEQLAKESGVQPESPAFDRWFNSVHDAHSDAEILDMYDAMVVAEQDKQATKVVSQFSTEAAALVAISPLAIADMLLVAWRNFKMIDKLAEIYGVELGYWSRIKLLKAVFINMAAAGASELAVDAGMDLLSMDLAGRLSARAGQGLGVGILTARLGLKAMSLLRPMPWHKDRAVKLSAIRKQIVAKVTAITMK